MSWRRAALLPLLALLTTVSPAQADISVKDAPHSAVGDAKAIADASITLSSTTLTSATANFAVGDVGKLIWCISTSVGVTNPVVPVTTIAARTSATQITLGASAIYTQAGVRCVYGTQDDTTAFTSAYNAAVAATGTSWPTAMTFLGGSDNIFIPKGGYIVSGRIYNKQDGGTAPAPGLIGAGRFSSVIFLRPDMAVPGDGTAVLIQATGSGGRFQHFGVDGMHTAYSTWGGEQDLIRFVAMRRWRVDDLDVRNVGSSSATSGAVVNFQDSQDGVISGMIVQDAPAASRLTACKFKGTAGSTVVASFCSNNYKAVTVSDNRDRSPTTMPLVWIGGGGDECELTSTPACTVLTDAHLNVFGGTFYGGATGQNAVSVDGTSTLWIYNSNVGAFNTVLSAVGLRILSGGKVVSGGTTFRGNAGGAAVQNSGTFIDTGGNDFANCTGTSCTTATTRRQKQDQFSGTLPTFQVE